ncbi:MAG: hypothetical protein HRT89_20870 [Lentisphaeria bacterium]|nr:hypothetical protein [Lentisphaeria bacterium]NQZ70513.1 hypothetical protein [Lentisphaeria bacterium]
MNLERNRIITYIIISLTFFIHSASAEDLKASDILKDYRALLKKLPWEVKSKDYKAAKGLIKGAKGLQKEASKENKATLRYVRASTNLALSCANLRKGGKLASRAAELYLAASLKDLTILASTYVRDKKAYGPTWKDTLKDVAIITAVYNKELVQAGGKIKALYQAIQKLLKDPESAEAEKEIEKK